MSSRPQSLMSTDKAYQKPARRRNDSGEIDVFEAARYFSGGIEGVGTGDGVVGYRRGLREEKVLPCRAERKSMDAPMKAILPQQSHKVECSIKNKKLKQPSSPGAKLASFLNSLFHQTTTKEKSKSLITMDERKRRSSMTHSHISDSKSINPTKVQREEWGDRRVMGQRSIDGLGGKSEVSAKLHGIRFLGGDLVCSDGFVENRWVLSRKDDGFLKDKGGVCGVEFMLKEEENGGESDSSSDLFELKNYDLGDRSSGLPVYGTTDRGIIEEEAAINAGVAF